MVSVNLEAKKTVDVMIEKQDELLDNIERKLYQLPDETIVFPGHGPGTTIGIEKTSNPFTRR